MAPDWRGLYLAILLSAREVMASQRLNCFIDEMGSINMSAGLYLVTLVFHDHESCVNDALEAYIGRLIANGLPDIPFHMVDLLHGKRDYSGLGPDKRKPLLYAFSAFVRTLPISYVTFSFDSQQATSKESLERAIRRSVSQFIFDHLSQLQEYKEIAVYYDGGSSVVSKAVHAAFDFSFARNVASYRFSVYSERRLMQAADYLNSIELAAIRYAQGRQSPTYERFYGDARKSKRNILKPARRLLWK